MTVRKQMTVLLLEKELDALDLSGQVGISEKDVYAHLSHVRQSVKHKGWKLVIRPSMCLGCRYLFTDRQRLTPPGRCPRCRGSYISNPFFRIEA